MSFRNELHALIGRAGRAGVRQDRRKARFARRPRLEVIEDRTLLTAISWTGTVSSDWDTPGNWNLNRLPIATDDVTIPASSTVSHAAGNTDIVHSIASSGSLSISAGTLTIQAASTFTTFTQSGGIINGAGNLAISGLFTFSGGTQSGIGQTNANGGMSLGGGGGSEEVDYRTLSLSGTSTMTGTDSLYLYHGSTLNIGSGATFTDSGSGSIYGGYNLATVNNAGTFTKATGTGIAYVNPRFVNTGTLDVKAGTVALYGGSGTGTYTAETGGTVDFYTGVENLAAASKINGAGTLELTSATLNDAGTVNVTGSTTIDAGGVFNLTGPITSLGSTLAFTSGGLLNLGTNNLSLTTLTQTGGTLTGSGTVTVSGSLSWTGGTQSGPGATTLTAASTTTLGPGSSETLDTRTLNNAGAVTLTGTDSLYLYRGATFNNQAGATFTINGSGSIYNGYNLGTFNNAGTFTKATNTGIAYVNARFVNTGTLDVKAGTVALYGGSGTGTYTAETGGTVDFFSGVENLAAASKINGAGTLELTSATLNDAGTVNVTGSTTLDGGGVFNLTGPITSLGSTLAFTSGGLLNLGTNNLSVATLNLTGGTLAGSGIVTTTAALNWSGGTMSGIGTTVVPVGAALTISGNNTSEYLVQRTLNNLNTSTTTPSTWSGTNNYIYASSGATFNNGTGLSTVGVLNITATGYFYPNGGATSTFNNWGSLTVNSPGTFTFYTPFNQDATSKTTNFVTVQAGQLSLNGGGSEAGQFVVSPGATLAFGGGVFNQKSTSGITGTGTASLPETVLFQNSTIDLNGGYKLDAFGITTVVSGAVNFYGTPSLTGSTFNVQGGTTNVAKAIKVGSLNVSGGNLTGAGAVTATANSSWTGGTMSGSGSTTYSTGKTLTIGGSPGGSEILDGRSIINYGIVNWSGAGNYIGLYDGAVFTNTSTATFNALDDGTVYNSGTTGTFINQGIYNKSSPTNSAVNFYPQFNNSKTVNINSGTLAFQSGFSSTAGTITVAAGAAIDFAGGSTSNTLGSASTLAGAGSVIFDNGNDTILGTYNITGSTTVNGGTVQFTTTHLTAIGSTLNVAGGSVDFGSSNVSTATVNESGGTISGSGTLTATSALNWSGGYMSGAGTTVVPAAATLTLGAGNGYEYLTGGRTLSNAGTANWSGTGYIAMYDGSVLNNSGTFNIANDSPILWSNSGEVINNTGTINKTAGLAGNSTLIYPALNNSGTINIQAGTFEPGSSYVGNGAVTIAAGATLYLDVYTATFGPSSSITGAGAVEFNNGIFNVNGTYNITGSTTVDSSATVQFATTALTAIGSTLNVAGGSVDFGSSNVSTATVNESGGTISGSGTLTATSALNWSGGYMSGAGTTVVPAAATLTLGAGNGTEYLVGGRTLSNAGTINWSGTGNFSMYDGSVLNNSGTFNIANDQTIGWGNNGEVINNTGTINKTAGAGTSSTDIYPLLNNSGTINIQAGKLRPVGSGLTNSGTITIAATTTLDLDGYLHTFTPTSSVSGAGSVVFDSGETDVSGSFSPTGAASVTAGATVNFNNSASTGAFTTAGTVSIASGATFTTSGDYTQTGGYTYLNGGTLAVGATHKVSIAASTYFYALGSVTGNLTNAGYLYVGGNQTVGTLSVSGTFTDSGAIYMDVQPGGYDQLAIAGAATWQAGSSLNTNADGSYVPTTGLTYTLVTYASHAGNPATESYYLNGTTATYHNNGTSITLTT